MTLAILLLASDDGPILQAPCYEAINKADAALEAKHD